MGSEKKQKKERWAPQLSVGYHVTRSTCTRTYYATTLINYVFMINKTKIIFPLYTLFYEEDAGYDKENELIKTPQQNMLREHYQYTVHDARYTEQCEFFFLLQKLIFQVRVYIE